MGLAARAAWHNARHEPSGQREAVTAKFNAAAIDAQLDAQEAWVAHVNEVGDTSLYPNCNSWYLGANVPGKPRVFMPYLGFDAYAERCREIVDNGYEGFALTG